MNELRKLEKAAKKYEKMLMNNPQKAKTYQNIYREDVKLLNKCMEVYIESETEWFLGLLDISIRIYNTVSKTILQRIKKSIFIRFINFLISKAAHNLSKAGTIQRGLKRIELRFVQFEYWN